MRVMGISDDPPDCIAGVKRPFFRRFPDSVAHVVLTRLAPIMQRRRENGRAGRDQARPGSRVCGALERVGGFVRVIGAAHQRTGLDVHEPEIERDRV